MPASEKTYIPESNICSSRTLKTDIVLVIISANVDLTRRTWFTTSTRGTANQRCHNGVRLDSSCVGGSCGALKGSSKESAQQGWEKEKS
ncbi:hypothetical protein KDI_37010 [Dictyobacter arantiisoli]|uniref:Uncharacterized protein n=1 Tax=Dictyobacter arantiisoli TaxID=2014874 RepID=A0A5A5TFK9_9CHLR|nr:hypothetical protein KDI_37010 [Dictyobacter arantiisoli]